MIYFHIYPNYVWELHEKEHGAILSLSEYEGATFKFAHEHNCTVTPYSNEFACSEEDFLIIKLKHPSAISTSVRRPK